MQTKPFAVETRALTKTYDSTPPLPVLSQVNIGVHEKEFVSFLSPSGCGKSTLFRLIAGLEDGYEGTIRMNGEDIRNGRKPVRYMLQKDLLMPWRTLMENVILPIEVRGGDLAEARETTMPLLKEFGLEEFAGYYPNQLSGGMRQRAAFLRTYLMQGDVMLLDEPFASLDEITRMDLQDWLLDIWQKHRSTVLFITHGIEEAIYLSDRIYVLNGRPGTIALEMAIDFPRPRTREMLLTPEFLAYKRTLMGYLVAR